MFKKIKSFISSLKLKIAEFKKAADEAYFNDGYNHAMDLMNINPNFDIDDFKLHMDYDNLSKVDASPYKKGMAKAIDDKEFWLKKESMYEAAALAVML